MARHGLMKAVKAAVVAFVIAAIVLGASGSEAKKRRKVSFKYDRVAHPNIATVTPADFRERVMDPTLPVILQFFDPTSPSSEEFAPELQQAAVALEGHATFAAMDGTTDEGKGVSQMFGVQSLPTTMLFNPEMLPVQGGQEGQYMKYPALYGGPKKAAKIVQWALEFSAGHEIDRLDDLVDWKDFADRYSASLALPKVVLVTSGNVTSPLFKSVSHQFRYGAQFAVVHGAELKDAVKAARGEPGASLKGELLAHLGLGADADRDGLPVVAMFGGGAQADAELVRDAGGPDFGIEQLAAAVAKVAWPEEKRKEMMHWFLDDAQQKRKKAAEEAKMNKALPPVTAYERSTFEEHCLKIKKGVCAAVFVENPDDEDALAWLEGASKKMAQRLNRLPSRLVVVGALQQPELAQFFGATDMGFPTVAFINPARKQYHNLVGAFSERGVVQFFVDRVPKAKGKPYDPKKVPKFNEPAEEDEAADQPHGGSSEDASNEDIVGDDL